MIIHEQPPSLAALMVQADLAVSGGGTTLYELACSGLPAIVLELADNQARGCRAMAAAGAVIYAGRAEAMDGRALGQLIADVLEDSDRRRRMTLAGTQLVDGLGADRVADALLSLSS